MQFKDLMKEVARLAGIDDCEELKKAIKDLNHKVNEETVYTKRTSGNWVYYYPVLGNRYNPETQQTEKILGKLAKRVPREKDT